MFLRNKTPLPSSSSSSSLSSSLLTLSSISPSQFISFPWCHPCLRSFGMKKTNYNHDRHHRHQHNHHHDDHNNNIHHCHSFSSPLWCRLCLRSFGRKISKFPSSRLVTFQHKIDFQTRGASSFLKKRQEILFFFQTLVLFQSQCSNIQT